MKTIVYSEVVTKECNGKYHFTMGVFNTDTDVQTFLLDIKTYCSENSNIIPVIDLGKWGRNSNLIQYNGPYENDRQPHVTLRINGKGLETFPPNSYLNLSNILVKAL